MQDSTLTFRSQDIEISCKIRDVEKGGICRARVQEVLQVFEVCRASQTTKLTTVKDGQGTIIVQNVSKNNRSLEGDVTMKTLGTL